MGTIITHRPRKKDKKFWRDLVGPRALADKTPTAFQSVQNRVPIGNSALDVLCLLALDPGAIMIALRPLSRIRWYGSSAGR